MSKARDIANILSANTAIATDAEVASSVSSAVSTHAIADIRSYLSAKWGVS